MMMMMMGKALLAGRGRRRRSLCLRFISVFIFIFPSAFASLHLAHSFAFPATASHFSQRFFLRLLPCTV